ncbi:MAG: PP2C family serine/threonine-protein phosphatase [Candidatus Moraniibacteriota bacterium]
MTRKKIDKRMPHLEPSFHDILICKKNDCRPFIEILIEEPENISHHNLGTLMGIFQIDDRSEDSSYVVNYLISIIKKEYFSRANRGPVENFESALHKANLALAKLATHENIGWIGSINAICAVIEKNNILLSQTGNASAFLLRGNTFTEITEIQDGTIDSNPLKTFQDVISGKIEKNDKLLLTTKEIFDIFSLEEIKKSALKFSRENFIQFLNTALVNELDQVASLVIDIDEKTDEFPETPPTPRREDVNVFSQTAFQKELSPKILEKERAKEDILRKERQEIIQELKDEAKDFVDKKTGHIYIKEAHNAPKEAQIEKIEFDPLPFFKEKFSGLRHSSAKLLKNATSILKDQSASLWEKSRAKISQIKVKKTPPEIEFLDRKTEKIDEPNTVFAQTEPEITPLERLSHAYSKLEIKARTESLVKKIKPGFEWLEEKTADGLILILRKPTNLTIQLIESLKNKWRNHKIKNQTEIKTQGYPWENSPVSSDIGLQKIATTPLQKTTNLGQFIEPKKILPNFSRLKQISKSLDRKQKLSALAALVLLLVVPYWIVKLENREIEKKPEIVEEIPAVILPLENDLNVQRIEKLNEIYGGSVSRIINLNDKFFAQKDSEIIELETKKSFPLSPDFQNPELSLGMDDLNLIFIVKNNKIISLAPTSGKFQANSIAFPEKAKIADAKTYLTYLYLLDGANNQIYRYPRAEGGFGEKNTWLKEPLDLSNAKSLAINENIFIINGQSIIKLFRGKNQPYMLEKTATPISPDKLSTQNASTNLYILDKTNSRIIKLDGEGKILAQYYNAEITNATDFSVSEENSLVYISDTNGVKSFAMNQ